MAGRKGTYKMVTVVGEKTIERNGCQVRIDILSCGHEARHFDYTEYYGNEIGVQIAAVRRAFSGKPRKTRCFKCAGGEN